MIRLALPVVLTLILTGSAGAEGRSQPAEVRHSGRILEIAPDRSTIVLEELVAWTGPGTGVVTRSIRLTPRTSIRLVERTGRWESEAAMPGWDTQVMGAAGLRRGDFVTVTTDDDQRSVAVALQVVRPDAE